MRSPLPGLGVFISAHPIGADTSPILSVKEEAPKPDPISTKHELHPDQKKYRNLTNGEVAKLLELTEHCLHAIELAVQRLERYLNGDLTIDQRKSLWSNELSCRWWGNFDIDIINTSRERFKSTAAAMMDSKTRFHMRRGSTNITPPYLGTVHLGDGFFDYTKWKQLDYFIHELSHLAGVWNLIERYGREKALALAQRNQHAVLRNSDNYAYYAQDCYLIELGHKDEKDLDACFVYPYDAGNFKNSKQRKPHQYFPAPW